MLLVRLLSVDERAQIPGTPRVAMAAKVSVAAVRSYVARPEPLDSDGGRRVQHVVVVPGELIGMCEDGKVGEVVIVGCDVVEVREGLMAFVEGDGRR